MTTTAALDANYLRTLTLLYVEDDNVVRTQLGRFLERRLGRVISASDGARGLEEYRAHQPDIVITDIQMPHMDGLTLAQRIRAEGARTPIVVTTAFDDSAYFMRAIDAAVEKYIMKPIDTERLDSVLRDLAHRLRLDADAEERRRLEADLLRSEAVAVVELLDHMRQAVLVFGKDGAIEESRSAVARKLFQNAPAGTHVAQLLFDDQSGGSTTRQLFDVWIEVAFDIDADDWAAVVESAPKEVSLACEADPEGHLWLELEFRPIFDEGRVARILLIATDVSPERRLTAKAEAERTRHDLELAQMRRLVGGSGPAFAEFLLASEARIAECRRITGADKLAPLDVTRALCIVHTLRGEARALGQESLAEACLAAEHTLEPLQSELPMDEREGSEEATARWRERLHVETRDAIARSQTALDSARELFVEASPTGRAALDEVGVRRFDLDALSALVRGRGDALETAVQALRARPFGECCAAIEAKATVWSEAERKPLRLVIHGREVLIPARLALVLGGAIIHLVRNAIAHGLEPESARIAAGKPHLGRVTLGAESRNASGEVMITVSDDGRGVDEARVRAAVIGTPLAGVEVGELLFASGLTTAKTRSELSGFGMGLYAVRDELRSAGYTVHAVWKAGEGTTFLIRPG